MSAMSYNFGAYAIIRTIASIPLNWRYRRYADMPLSWSSHGLIIDESLCVVKDDEFVSGETLVGNGAIIYLFQILLF